MAITLDKIVGEAAQLPADVSAELVERILVARHGGMEPDIEAAWNAEARSRVEEIAGGKVKGVPVKDALAHAARVLHR